VQTIPKTIATAPSSVIDPEFPGDPKTGNGLPFTLADVRNAIPEECFQPNTWRSLAYFFLDVGLVTGLYAIAHALDSWLFWPAFWFMQGTLFWALFVVGHDCGHGSFSRLRWLNNLIGHLSHTFILVPYHGWRISHRTHHANTGNVDTDESWYPVTEAKYRQMSWYEKLIRFQLLLFAYPLYLFRRSPGKQGSHFLPSSPLFRPNEKGDIITSTTLWIIMVVGLAAFGWQFGGMALLKYYIGPYLVFVVWLDLVTFLHHTDPEVPWYRGESWNFLKGALSSVDRDYGIFNSIHHNIGTHVAHHIFLSIPHYHLKQATAAIKPILGDHYRKSDEPIWSIFWRSLFNCHFVPDQGGTLYYQPAKSLKD
jgi:acyl-lipid omega-3 desaturase